jgi:CRP-like cAMP-binding protein/ribosomal protein S18 acetylase RimI-like enzyme
MTDYDVRLAIARADRAAAFELRYRLYVEDQGLFVDVADHERRWLCDPLDEEAAIWVARVGDEVVGTIRLVRGGDGRFDHDTREIFDLETFDGVVDEREIAVASRLVVMPEHRDGPLAKLLLTQAVAQAIERELELVVGECEPHLLDTWIRIGMRPYGLSEHPVNGTRVRVAFVLGDEEHVRRLDSPLAPIVIHHDRGDRTPTRLREVIRSNQQQVISETEGRARFFDTVERAVARAELARRLGELTDDELEALLAEGHALDCEAGAMLIRKGHVSRTLYVLLAGSLVVRDEGETIAELCDAGDILGEVAFFTDGERISDVLAGSDGARVLALGERSLKALVQTQGTGAAKLLLAITRGLCDKLRQRAKKPSEAPTLVGVEAEPG